MSDSKEAQAARNEVDRQLREENPERYVELMHAAFAKRGLTWSRRLTAEERAERERREAQDKARIRIEAEAKKAGLQVSVFLPPEVESVHRIGGNAKEFIVEGGKAAV